MLLKDLQMLIFFSLVEAAVVDLIAEVAEAVEPLLN